MFSFQYFQSCIFFLKIFIVFLLIFSNCIYYTMYYLIYSVCSFYISNLNVFKYSIILVMFSYFFLFVRQKYFYLSILLSLGLLGSIIFFIVIFWN